MTYPKTRTFLSIMLLVALILIPTVSFAKENDKGKNKDEHVSAKVKIIKEDRREKNDDDKEKNKGEKNERQCMRAWGHLIAPGWIKKNGQLEIGTECHLPFGIGKKFRGNATTTTATSTPDTVAPVISNITISTPKPTKAIINWVTNEKSDSSIWYSTVSPVSTTGSPSTTKSSRVLNHTIELSNLSASTTYYAVVRSRDAAGNMTTSSTLTFTTPMASTTDNRVPTISNVVAIVGTSTVKVGWSTNIAADSHVFYSTTSPVVIGATSTVATSNSTLVNDHTMNITGLATSTTYSFIIRSTTSAGMSQTTLPFTITTSGL